jgi:RNA polymerase sigma factor (sigma-70 family)
MPDDPSFADLIARVRAGDEQACRTLVQKYGQVIRSVARTRLTHLGLRRLLDSTDVCQSVLAKFFFLTALSRLDLSREGQVKTLLATMARNELANHARRHKAARRDHRRTSGASDEGEFIDPAPSPGEVAAGKELLHEVRRRLTEEEQRLAERRAQGCSWAEIAAEVGGQPDALRMQLSRAVSRVRAELQLEE